jgi:hypothetical protein
MKKTNQTALVLAIGILASAPSFGADLSKITPYFGHYTLDQEASSKECNEALAYTIRPYSEGGKVSVQSPGFHGFTLENASSGWSNVYDLNMFFSREDSTLQGQRAWQISTMVSLFGVEREVKKFLFTEDKDHPFVIATRRTYAKLSEGVDLTPKTVICAYRKD